METKYWGRAFWTSMFSVALTYPRNPKYNDILHYKQYFISLKYVLPCHKCKKNYTIKLKKHSLDNALKIGRKELFKWVLNIHNLVAKDLGKKQFCPFFGSSREIKSKQNLMKINVFGFSEKAKKDKIALS